MASRSESAAACDWREQPLAARPTSRSRSGSMPRPSSSTSMCSMSPSARTRMRSRPAAGLPSARAEVGRLQAVVHRVAQQVHQRVADVGEHRAVHADVGVLDDRDPPPCPAAGRCRAPRAGRPRRRWRAAPGGPRPRGPPAGQVAVQRVRCRPRCGARSGRRRRAAGAGRPRCCSSVAAPRRLRASQPLGRAAGSGRPGARSARAAPRARSARSRPRALSTSRSPASRPSVSSISTLTRMLRSGERLAGAPPRARARPLAARAGAAAAGGGRLRRGGGGSVRGLGAELPRLPTVAARRGTAGMDAARRPWRRAQRGDRMPGGRASASHISCGGRGARLGARRCPRSRSEMRVARAQQQVRRHVGGGLALALGASTSSAACASWPMAARPSMRASPFIVCSSRATSSAA